MERLSWRVEDETMLGRLDSFLSAQTGDSRAQIQTLIKSGEALVNDQAVQKPSYQLNLGDQICLKSRPVIMPTDWEVQTLDLTPFIIFEDAHLLLINKPAGWVTHPGAGHHQDTLANYLLGYHAGASVLPRAGIVHRLDKDTSGILVVAKTEDARISLIDQLQTRALGRLYVALVYGNTAEEGLVDQPIGRHPKTRYTMAVTPQGKEAITLFRTLACREGLTLLELSLKTGKTHQIRVHMQHLGHPLIGDPIYKRVDALRGVPAKLMPLLGQFDRQALHAKALRFIHPVSGKPNRFKAPVPEDMQALLSRVELDG